MSDGHAEDSGRSGPPEIRQEAEQRLHANHAASAATPSEGDVRALLHELQVRQIELEMQNQELLRAEAAAREALQKYRDLFDGAPTGYFRLDEQGRILEISLAGAALLGQARSAAVKRRLLPFVATDERRAFEDFCGRVRQSGLQQTGEFRLVQGGCTRNVLVEGISPNDGTEDGSESFLTLTDITAVRLGLVEGAQ